MNIQDITLNTDGSYTVVYEDGSTVSISADGDATSFGNLILGTDDDDRLIGSKDADIIYGFSGDDILLGKDGDDILSGGSGVDLLIAGKGNDTLLYDVAENVSNTDVDIYDGGQDSDILVIDVTGLVAPPTGFSSIAEYVSALKTYFETEIQTNSEVDFRDFNSANGGDGALSLRVRNVEEIRFNALPEATDQTFTVDEDISLANIIEFLDPDGDTPTIHKINNQEIVSGQTIILASGAALTINSNGSFTYNQQGEFDQLSAGDLATDSFEYTIVDDDNNESTATVSIKISGINDAPVANSEVSALDADMSLTLGTNLLANDTDVDSNQLFVDLDTIKVIFNGTEDATLFGENAVIALDAQGNAILQNLELLSIAANDDSAKVLEVQYFVEDNLGLKSETSASWTINLTNLNRPISSQNAIFTIELPETTNILGTSNTFTIDPTALGYIDPEGGTMTIKSAEVLSTTLSTDRLVGQLFTGEQIDDEYVIKLQSGDLDYNYSALSTQAQSYGTIIGTTDGNNTFYSSKYVTFRETFAGRGEGSVVISGFDDTANSFQVHAQGWNIFSLLIGGETFNINLSYNLADEVGNLTHGETTLSVQGSYASDDIIYFTKAGQMYGTEHAGDDYLYVGKTLTTESDLRELEDRLGNNVIVFAEDRSEYDDTSSGITIKAGAGSDLIIGSPIDDVIYTGGNAQIGFEKAVEDGLVKIFEVENDGVLQEVIQYTITNQQLGYKFLALNYADVVVSGDGDDTVYTTSYNNTDFEYMSTALSNDFLHVGQHINTGNGDDTVYITNGAMRVNLGEGNDTLTTLSGELTLGSLEVYLDTGNDTVNVGALETTVYGGTNGIKNVNIGSLADATFVFSGSIDDYDFANATFDETTGEFSISTFDLSTQVNLIGIDTFDFYDASGLSQFEMFNAMKQVIDIPNVIAETPQVGIEFNLSLKASEFFSNILDPSAGATYSYSVVDESGNIITSGTTTDIVSLGISTNNFSVGQIYTVNVNAVTNSSLVAIPGAPEAPTGSVYGTATASFELSIRDDDGDNLFNEIELVSSSDRYFSESGTDLIYTDDVLNILSSQNFLVSSIDIQNGTSSPLVNQSYFSEGLILGINSPATQTTLTQATTASVTGDFNVVIAEIEGSSASQTSTGYKFGIVFDFWSDLF